MDKYTPLSFFRNMRKKGVCYALKKDKRKTKKDITSFLENVRQARPLKIAGYTCTFLIVGIVPIAVYEVYKKFKDYDEL